MFGSKRKEIRKIGSAFDRLLNYTLTKDEDLNTHLIDLADILMANRPILANFEEIKSRVNRLRKDIGNAFGIDTSA